MALDAEALREHLNMFEEEGDSLDEGSLSRLLHAAMAHTAAQLGFALDDASEFPNGTPKDVELAVLMLAAWWFNEAREAAVIGVTAQTVPHGYDDIVRNHRSYTYG